MKLSDLLATCGKGCEGIERDRDQQGAHLALEVLLHPFLLAHVAVAVRNDLDPLLGESGREIVVVERVLPFHQPVGGGGDLLEAAACCRGPVSPPATAADRCSAARTSKNSSRLDDTMVRKRRRSSSGTPGRCAQSSTRSLKARML
jgi:hypothetical protein